MNKKFKVFCKCFLETEPEQAKTGDKIWLWDEYQKMAMSGLYSINKLNIFYSNRFGSILAKYMYSPTKCQTFGWTFGSGLFVAALGFAVIRCDNLYLD